jgi:hypothetical protein
MHSTAQLEEAAMQLLNTSDGPKKFVHQLLETLGPEGRDWLALRVLGTNTAEDPQGNTAFAHTIGAPEYDQSRAKALELASLINYFEYRKSLLSNSLTAPMVADMLGVSRQTINERMKQGQLLGVLDNNVSKFPEWQFDPEGPNGVVAGLNEVLAALSGNVFSKISWLSSPNGVFGGRRPIDALKQGKKIDVVHEARSVGVA